MPDYRKLYNRVEMGERTSRLTDFEFRVWIICRACADDFGVCPLLPGLLKGKSRRLAPLPDRVVLRAMEHLIEAHLCLVFEHQGLRYLCQDDWQDWEEIRYPKISTEHPSPLPEIFGKLSAKTQKLFRDFHPTFQKLPRAGVRKTETLTQTETETSTEESPRETTAQPRPHAPSIAGESPLSWGKKHSDHVAGFCDWLCFPQDLFHQFARRLNDRPEEVLTWARTVRSSGIIASGRMYDFWNAQFERSYPSEAQQPKTLGEKNKAVLQRFVERHGRDAS